MVAFCRDRDKCALVGAIHELPLQCRRDPLNRPDENQLTTHSLSMGTTSVPLRTISRRDVLVGSALLEGPACRVRHFRRDVLVTSAVLRWIIPSHLAGHDKRAPPNDFSEGPACHVRPLGGTRLSGPPLDVGSSIFFSRGLKSRAESGAKAPHSIWSAAIHRRFSVKA